jgi:hypothetical protein
MAVVAKLSERTETLLHRVINKIVLKSNKQLI